jgi:cyanophycinase
VSSQEISPVFVSATQLLTEKIIAQSDPTGIFVCGGLTPLYQEALCTDQGWLHYVRTRQIPYGGFSAGAAIAAERAIVGGWKVRENQQEIAILDADLAEDLEFLDVRTGLGLIPFAIDVHGSQWGTLTRLIHAIDQEMVSSGWAVDEDTMLHVVKNTITVFGLGQAYHVQRHAKGKLQVEIFRDGSTYQW